MLSLNLPAVTAWLLIGDMSLLTGINVNGEVLKQEWDAIFDTLDDFVDVLWL